jgi:hypothetical protein
VVLDEDQSDEKQFSLDPKSVLGTASILFHHRNTAGIDQLINCFNI